MSDRSYIIPPDVGDPATLRAQAQRRRAALEAHGCCTYSLGRNNGALAMVCLCCGLGSVHPGDIAEKYCGFCRTWHSEWRD